MVIDLQQQIAAGAGYGSTVTFIAVQDGTITDDTVAAGDLYLEAVRLGAEMTETMGFSAASKVGVIGANVRPLITAIEAVWISGAAIAVLPIPFRPHDLDEFVESTRHRVQAADLDFVLLDELAAGFLDGRDLGAPTAPISDLQAAASRRTETEAPTITVSPSDLAILQFTSGSTSAPKAVQVTYQVLQENLAAIAARYGLNDRDVVVSWLPLYHDMGLVGIIGSVLTSPVSAVLATPRDFVSSPGLWMHLISRYRGTITFGPNFAYVLAARELAKVGDVLDLSSLRIAGNGAEPVSPDSVRDFVSAGSRHRLSPGAMHPVYGMAEVGIGTAFPVVGSGMTTEYVDGVLLATDHIATPVHCDHPSAKEVVLLGRPLECLTLMVADPETGTQLPARHVGEIYLSGLSVTPGYYKDDQANQDAFHGEWLKTGDLGYVTEDGQVVVTGRKKDVIIISGHNVYPQDIEAATSAVDGIRAGNVAAFGVADGGTERLYVVAESREGDSGHLRRSVKASVSNHCGFVPHRVVIIAPGSIPKTSSGKIKRQECKKKLLNGDFGNARLPA